MIRQAFIFQLFLSACTDFAIAQEDFPAPVNTQAKGEHPPSPREMLDLFELPAGFNVTLFAGEPDVQQPIAFDFDDRGRIWVAENYTYSAHAKIDQHMRDRIIILEDKDGDGEHDERKVFWDKGRMLTGLTWGYGGLWILNDGTLSFLADKDGDDIPDGEPVEMLNGWTKEAGHNVVNGLLWGPDGWLYGRHGITETSLPGTPDTPKEERNPMNCGIWRFHPTNHSFEIVCHGTTNPWGLDYNEYGDMFMTNNVIGHLWHVIPGAHYQRMFGQDFNPHCYELLGPISDHYHWDDTGKWNESRDGKADDLGGGHSHCGGMIYYGQNFPKEYRGKMFMCNTHGRCVNVNRIERKGSSYVGKREPNFLKVNTPWFRGVELKYGPRGCVYLTDWSDNGECHDHDGVHRTSGRIYRISYGNGDLTSVDSLDTIHGAKPSESYDRLFSSSTTTFKRRKSRRQLYESIAADDAHLDPNSERYWEKLFGTYKGHRLMRGWPVDSFHDNDAPRAVEMVNLWAWAGVTSSESYTKALLSMHSVVRATAVRAAFENPDIRRENRELFRGLLRVNESPVVGLAYATGLQRWPKSEKNDITMGDGELFHDYMDHQEVIMRLTRDETQTARIVATDSVLELMTWYGVLHHASRVGAGMNYRCESSKIARFAIRYAMEAADQAWAANENDKLTSLFSRISQNELSEPERVLGELEALLKGVVGKRMAMPTGWNRLKNRFEKFDNLEIKGLVKEFEARFGNQSAVNDLYELVSNRQGDHVARSRAIATLEQMARKDTVPVILPLLTDRAVYVDVAKALAAFDDPRIPTELLSRWKNLRHGSREAATDTLCSRKSYAVELAKALGDGRIQSHDLTATHVRKLLAFDDPIVTKIVEDKWGVINDSPQAKVAAIDSWKRKLTPDVLTAANHQNGAALFKKSCGACHKLYGEGGKIGPELTGGNRGNLTYLLGNVIDPSAEVPKQYTTSAIALTSGRVISGVVVAETPQTVTVQTDKDTVKIATSEIEDRVRTNKSLMPDGLFDALSEQQVIDLIAFVQKRR